MHSFNKKKEQSKAPLCRLLGVGAVLVVMSTCKASLGRIRGRNRPRRQKNLVSYCSDRHLLGSARGSSRRNRRQGRQGSCVASSEQKQLSLAHPRKRSASHVCVRAHLVGQAEPLSIGIALELFTDVVWKRWLLAMFSGKSRASRALSRQAFACFQSPGSFLCKGGRICGSIAFSDAHGRFGWSTVVCRWLRDGPTIPVCPEIASLTEALCECIPGRLTLKMKARSRRRGEIYEKKR